MRFRFRKKGDGLSKGSKTVDELWNICALRVDNRAKSTYFHILILTAGFIAPDYLSVQALTHSP
jgi:hypothetical protein